MGAVALASIVAPGALLLAACFVDGVRYEETPPGDDASGERSPRDGAARQDAAAETGVGGDDAEAGPIGSSDPRCKDRGADYFEDFERSLAGWTQNGSALGVVYTQPSGFCGQASLMVNARDAIDRPQLSRSVAPKSGVATGFQWSFLLRVETASTGNDHQIHLAKVSMANGSGVFLNLEDGEILRFWEESAGGASPRRHGEALPGFAVGAWVGLEITLFFGSPSRATVKLGPPGEEAMVLEATLTHPFDAPAEETLGVSWAAGSGVAMKASYDRDAFDVLP